MLKSQKKPITINVQQSVPPGTDAKLAKGNTSNKIIKAEQVIKLLRRKNGANIGELQKITGWQAHSVHGFLSSTVRKRMGLSLKSEVTDKGERRYLIAQA